MRWKGRSQTRSRLDFLFEVEHLGEKGNGGKKLWFSNQSKENLGLASEDRGLPIKSKSYLLLVLN